MVSEAKDRSGILEPGCAVMRDGRSPVRSDGVRRGAWRSDLQPESARTRSHPDMSVVSRVSFSGAGCRRRVHVPAWCFRTRERTIRAGVPLDRQRGIRVAQ